MKIGAFLILLVLSSCAILRADVTFWNNGITEGTSQRPDANVPCCGSTGWTVYDDFTVPSNVTTITGLSYTDYLAWGTWSDYLSTNWSLFSSANDPFGVPLYSGTAVFTMTPQGGGAMLFSVTGLNIPITSGHWFVGFQNNFSGNDVSSRAYAAGNGLPDFWLQDNMKQYQFVFSPLDTAFTVSGTATPEPSSFMLLCSALVGISTFRAAKLLHR